MIPVCPEVLAGFGVPRPPMAFETLDEEQLLDRELGLVDDSGRDRTAQLLDGVRRAVSIVDAAGATHAILKEKSPSCGVNSVYLGSACVPGRGLFTAVLRRRGVVVTSDEELE